MIHDNLLATYASRALNAAVTTINRRDFQKFTSASKPSFVKFMRHSPLAGLKLNFKRDKSLFRGKNKTGL